MKSKAHGLTAYSHRAPRVAETVNNMPRTGLVDSAMLSPLPQEMFARVEQHFYVRCK
jgi:hypothetical protein